MAVTNEYSDQLTKIYPVAAGSTNPAEPVEAHELGGRKRVAVFEFTQGAAAGDATSTAELIELPGGTQRILADESKVYYSAFGSARTLAIGYRAYTNADGTAVAESSTALNAATSVASAGSFNVGAALQVAASGGMATYDSRDGITIFGTVAGGTIPAAATIKGHITYVVD